MIRYKVLGKDIYLLLNDAKKYHIQLYHLTRLNQNEFEFIVKNKLPSQFTYVTYISMIGIMRFIVMYFTKKFRFIGVCCGLLWLCFLNQLSYGCLIDDSYPKIQKNLQQLSTEYRLNECHRILEDFQIEEIEKKIKEQLFDEIDYLDIFLDENIYKITYTKKKTSIQQEKEYTPLIANQDAVVDKIVVESGNVLVKRGQYVSKGQTLVSNELLSTSENIRFLAVKGKIYGYVYHTFEASVEGQLNVDTYTLLYQEILNKVYNEILEDGYVIQENVLQYRQKEGKIVLKIQFTLYQNIAIKEFFNE